jgi:hypothetical protein
MYLVLIETSGNQNFIFATNKLKENIGASELTYQAGTKWILAAVVAPNDTQLLGVWTDSKRLRKLLRDPETNPPVESQQKPVEILTAASGKALLLTKDKETAQTIISEVTKKALIDAPGLDISGVYVKIENWDEINSLAAAIKEVHKKLEKEKVRLPSPQNRFLRLPIIASCAVSGSPASQLEELSKEQKKNNPTKKPRPISKISAVKQDKAKEAKRRLTNLDERLQSQIDRLLRDEESTEEKRSWLAVVHADGNGLGQIFMNFEDYIGADKTTRNYINKYREFSLALDECTEAAFKKALDVLPKEESSQKNDFAPIVPLIIGGDDLTVVCDGKYALEFTKVFLQKFEKQTKTKFKAFGINCLSACAGVAIVKRHFPFSVAYHLAEQLIKSAKEVKQKVTKLGDKNTPFPCSAIDFHILYDTSGIDLNDLREKLEPELDTKLYNRPYIVSEIDNLKTADGYEWAKLHEWKILSERVEWLNNDESTSDNLKPVSSSQSHAIRTALFLGKDETKAQYGLIEQRYDLKKFAESETKNSLFYQSIAGDYITSFLDALDAKDFLKSAQDQMEETS